MNKIGYVAVFVSDMDRAVDFYEKKLGIPVKSRTAEFPVWVEMATEGVTLALNSAAPDLVGRPTGVTVPGPRPAGPLRAAQRRRRQVRGPA